MLAPLTMLVITSCQPPDSPVATNVPEEWPIRSFSHNKTVDLAHLHWWKQFKNQELDRLTQNAVAQNSELKIAITRIEQAQQELNTIKLSWVPGLNFLAGYNQFPDLSNTGALAIAYPAYFVNILQLYQKQKSAKALYKASRYEYDGVKIALIARTAASFFVLLEQIEALSLYQKLLRDSRAYLKGIKTQYTSGLIMQDTLLEQERGIKLIESQIDVIRYNVIASKNALHYLLDEHPGTMKITTKFNQLDTAPFIPGNQPVSVVQNRPDVRQLEALLNTKNSDTAAIKATFFPEITLGSYLGTSGNYGKTKLSRAFASGPIIDLSLIPKIKGAKARSQEYALRYRDTILRALRDVTNDLAAFAAYDQQVTNNTQALNTTEKKCALVTLRYQNGLVSSLSPLQCAIEVDQLAVQTNQNKLEKLLALVSLYQDLGGGVSWGLIKVS